MSNARMWHVLSKRVASWSLPKRARGAGTPIGGASDAHLGNLRRSSSPAAKALKLIRPAGAKVLQLMRPPSAKLLAWGGAPMPESPMDPRLQASMDALYRDTVSLGDQARGWFDGPGRAWRAQLSVADQAAVATESLATTGRLMAVMAWLLDPAQGTGADAPLRPLVIDAAAEPVPDVLHTVPGGEIAWASQQLVARAEALVRSAAGAA